MDVSKPSDLAVLTGGYSGRGMAKPSATRDGRQRKKKIYRGVAKRERSPSVYVCVCSQPTIAVTKCGAGVMRLCRLWVLLLKLEIAYSCKTQTDAEVLWQPLVVSSAFPPHRYRHLASINQK